MSVSTGQENTGALPHPYAAALVAEGAGHGIDASVLLHPDQKAGAARALVGAAFLRTRGAPPSPTMWRPLFPLSLTSDVLRTVALLDGELFRTVQFVDVTVSFGPPPWDAGWLEPWPEDAFEALAWGFHVAERLAGTPLIPGRLAALGDVVVLLERSAAVLGAVRVAPATMRGIAGFSARVDTDAGSVLVRHPFAPGSVCVWDSARLEYRSAAAQGQGTGQMRPAASTAGGSSARELVQWLLHDSPQADTGAVQADLQAEQNDALRIVRDLDAWLSWRAAR